MSGILGDTHALIVGKFYPPHTGHHFLIESALADGHKVTVMVMENPIESISGMARLDILEEVHAKAIGRGKLRLLHIYDDLPVDYDDPEVDMAHARLVAGRIAENVDRLWEPPDFLYTSEHYGDQFAESLTKVFKEIWGDMPDEYLTVEHRQVDLMRLARPVSGTRIRNNPVGNWDFLAGPTKRLLTRRVVICGAESTGTTTLAKALAERYQTIWVPEWGRLFSEATGSSHRWTTDDFKLIMDEHNRQEDLLAQHAGPVMFCDTDNMATLMFHELYMHTRAPTHHWVQAKARAGTRDLYIITDHTDIPFDDDGYRLFETQRAWATGWFIDNLADTGAFSMLVTGSHAERMEQACEHIDDLLDWDLPAVEEYGKKVAL